MKSGIRMAVMTAAVAALVGCGGGAKIGSKDEAASVAFGAGSPATRGAQGGALSIFQSGQFSGTTSIDCSNGGTATLSISTDGFDGEAGGTWGVVYEIAYANCAEPRHDDPNTAAVESGEVVLDGSLTMAMDADIQIGDQGGSVAIALRMQGRIDVGGDYSDFVDMDVTQTITAQGNATGGSSSVTIDGTISTSSGTYTYENETYTFASNVGA